jgi:hypothetical protein
MGITPTPVSTKVSSSSSSWSDFLDAISGHISGSSVWSLKNNDVNFSGDDGITITPDDSNYNFDINFRYDSNDGQPYVATDPNSQISDATDPTGTGSSSTHETGPCGPSSPSLSTDVLIAEWPDALAIMFKDSGGSYVPVILFGGKFYEPFFSNDESRGFDGLMHGGGNWDPSQDWTGYFVQGYGGKSYALGPDGWNQAGPEDLQSKNSFNNTDAPYPKVVRDGGQRDGAPYGLLKYIYFYHTTGGGSGMHRLDSGNGEGFLYLTYDGSSRPWVIGWDPNTTP